MKIDVAKLNEMLKDRKGRPVERNLNLEALKDSGVAFASYGINEGDVIQFPTEDDLAIFAQPVRQNGTAKQYMIGVIRNGENSILSLGSLRATDKDRKAYGKVAEELTDASRFSDDMDRVKHLFGKTIKCTHMVTGKVGKWDTVNNRTSTTEFVDRNFASCEYVD